MSVRASVDELRAQRACARSERASAFAAVQCNRSQQLRAADEQTAAALHRQQLGEAARVQGSRQRRVEQRAEGLRLAEERASAQHFVSIAHSVVRQVGQVQHNRWLNASGCGELVQARKAADAEWRAQLRWIGAENHARKQLNALLHNQTQRARAAQRGAGTRPPGTAEEDTAQGEVAAGQKSSEGEAAHRHHHHPTGGPHSARSSALPLLCL